MSPSSGARSGTKPGRSERGAGTGALTRPIQLECGHTLDSTATPAVVFATGRKLYHCPDGCGLHGRRA